jgi:hypothetical protein
VCDFSEAKINLNAFVFEPSLSLEPNPVEFLNVWPGDTLIKKLTLYNNSDFDVTVNGLSITANPNIYILDKTPPLIIGSGQSESLTLMFIAQKTGNYTDSLLIEYSGQCDYDTSFTLISSVTDEIYDVQLSIDDYITAPYETIYIAINLDKEVPKFRPDSLIIELGFDPWLFSPEQAYYLTGNGAVELRATLQPGYAKLHIPKRFADTMFLSAGKKINIQGQTFPSSPNKTSLSFISVDIYTNKVIDLTKDNGTLEVTPVCNPTARLHLILRDNIQIYMKSNTVNKGQLSIDIISSGNTGGIIKVYTSKGREILSESSKFIKGNNTLNLDLSGFATGVYYFILNTSTGQVFTRKFVVIN